MRLPSRTLTVCGWFSPSSRTNSAWVLSWSWSDSGMRPSARQLAFPQLPQAVGEGQRGVQVAALPQVADTVDEQLPGLRLVAGAGLGGLQVRPDRGEDGLALRVVDRLLARRAGTGQDAVHDVLGVLLLPERAPDWGYRYRFG
ncbi:hypothetical protein ACFZAV_09535 [Streptomyces sp. NPDC008343]|uniref:hypothetical protein n=1 Tax=Streptomyces sp. NPDC008343 TaxID=3364828 RepID=UPI0036F1299B